MKRAVSLTFVVLSLFLAPAAYPFGQNKIVYDKFDWKVYHSTHFDIYFYEEERNQLQRVVDNAESAYLDLSQKFNYQISKKIPLIFYATHSAFEQTNVSLNFIPEGVGAFAEPARNRMVLPIDMPDDKLYQLIAHELTHIFEYEILFQGKFGKNITANPPLWMMEGLASYMAQDEEARDRMVLRDAVVNDRLPRITQNPQGYFAYRFGHAVFKYIVAQHGIEGLRDFVYEYRNTLGSSVDRALKRAFDVTPEEFDSAFRIWLRRQYLPALITKGEPQEYGEPFRINPELNTSSEISPVPSPSGDLLAGFTTYKEDIDVVIFNIPERRLLKNLTAGYTAEYEHPTVQSFTTAPVMGRDLAWAPNGDQVALFVKKERGRNLLLINPLSGEIVRSIPMAIEQQLAPAYSPDGKRVAFAGFLGNQSDIFIIDLESGEIQNATSDRFFDGAPVYSPDGKWLYYSSVGERYAKIYRLNLANPKERYQVTQGDWNDIDAYFSPDGKRLFFSSDKGTGRSAPSDAAAALTTADERKEGETTEPDPANFNAYNIYSLDLTSGDLVQYTDVIGGTFSPVVFTGANNRERMVFSSYYKGQWRLYSTSTDKPIGKPERVELATTPIAEVDRSIFRPTSEFFIDEEKIEGTGGFRLFIDDVAVNAGVSSDQLFVSRSTIFMSDMLGNRRFIASLDSVSTFSNFDFIYLDMQRRLSWGARLFDDRSFYVTQDLNTGELDSRQIYRQTGALGLLSYPFSRYHRVDGGLGFMSRDAYLPMLKVEQGQQYLEYERRRDNYPLLTTSFTGDSTAYKSFGPISGRRYQFTTAYAMDTQEGGMLSGDVSMDFRQYYQISSRTLLAARVFAAYSEGNAPNFYYFGGLNTLRGYDFRTLIGNRAGFANVEFRFPLIDVLATPVFVLQQVRGNLFFDIGAAQVKGVPFQFATDDGFLADARASVGWGLSFNFLGMELHWDFAQRFNGKDTEGNFRTSFWIGETF